MKKEEGVMEEVVVMNEWMNNRGLEKKTRMKQTQRTDDSPNRTYKKKTTKVKEEEKSWSCT